MKKTNSILIGGLFIIIGIILALNILGLANINIFFKGWWTLFIIIPCLIGLKEDKDKTGNIIGIILGVSLLLASRGILQFENVWKLLAPAILIIIGMSIILKDTIQNNVKKEISKLNTNNEKEYYATFSNQNISLTKDECNGAHLNAIFGGITCNLENIELTEDCLINATSIFGGITLYLPEDLNVKITSTSIFGGVSEKRSSKENTKKETLYINVTCIFGGVEIK